MFKTHKVRLIQSKNKVNLESRNTELNQDMREASLKLTNADQMATLGTMMASVIHDMNNPLQFISDLDQVYTSITKSSKLT